MRRAIVAGGAAVVVLACAGIAVAASLGGGSGKDDVVQITNSTPPSRPPTSLHSPRPAQHSTSTSHATPASTGATQTPAPPEADGLVVDATTKANGSTVTVVVKLSGRVPQLYDAATGKPIPDADMTVSGTSVTWGDGSPDGGAQVSGKACHANAPLVSLPSATETFRHNYRRSGAYQIHLAVGDCSPIPRAQVLTVTVPSGAGGTASGPSTSAVRNIMHRTFETQTPSEHFVPSATPVTTHDAQGGLLTAVIGLRHPSADGKGDLVFFWHDRDFIGWDSDAEAISTLKVVAVSGGFAVTYANYAKKDAYCCPSLPPATIDYLWTGSRMRRSRTVPRGVYGLNNGYTHAITVQLG
jgi:hypothetical protein